MKRLLLMVCVMCALFAGTTCFAQPVDGVLVKDRVINLPNDQDKWYVSVVGDVKNAQYQTILNWFKQNTALRRLKNQVHFCPVLSNSVIYKTRYAMNVKGLPTVRLQNQRGIVIYEAAGKNLPRTAEGLYGALANSSVKAGKPFLPWRRNHKCPGPCPQPEPAPDLDLSPDPEPQPIDDGGELELEPAPFPVPVRSSLPPLGLMLITLVGSAGAGVLVEWRALYSEK